MGDVVKFPAPNEIIRLPNGKVFRSWTDYEAYLKSLGHGPGGGSVLRTKAASEKLLGRPD